MATPKELLHRLFEYIGEQLKDIDPRGFRLTGSKNFMLRRGDLAGLPGVRFDIPVEGDYIWLRIDRLEAGKPPTVAEAFRSLIQVSDDPNGTPPALNEAQIARRVSEVEKGRPPAERKELEARARAAAQQALDAYLSIWTSWAEGEKPRRKTIGLYGDFFSIKHALEAEETARPSELAWGIGITTWKIPAGGQTIDFEYPLLTQALEISVDDKSFAIEIRPRDTATRFEVDAFIACSVKGAADVERTVRQHLERHKDRPVTPFDPGSYSDVLKLVANNLDSEGRYVEVLASDSPVPAPDAHIVATDAWVLMTRPRTNNFLVQDLARLQDKLAGEKPLPEGVLALVSEPSDEPVNYEAVNFRGLSSRGKTRGGKAPEELYFPLPYNDEQVTIVSRLERAPGVTVQGPPGTGKTHTIANIICHYLATGRRVLVTSKGEPALNVLQTKLPEEVRSLSVALLTGDRESIKQFQGSIAAIQHQVSQLNPALVEKEIETLKSAINFAHVELAKIDKRVDEIALAQLSEVNVDGVPMRAQKLAGLVVSGKERFGWFDDVLTFDSVAPLTEDQGRALREARRTLGQDLVYVLAPVPSAEDFPAAAQVAVLHTVLCRMRDVEERERTGAILQLIAFTQEVITDARQLLAGLEKALTLVEDISTVPGGWPFQLRANCRLSAFASEREALESLFQDMRTLVEARAEFLKRPVDMSPACLASTRALEAIAKAAETGSPFGMLSFAGADTKKLVGTVTVSGLAPTKKDEWELVHRFIGLHSRVVSFTARWNGFAQTMSLPHLSGGIANLRSIELTAMAALKAHTLATTFDVMLPGIARRVFAKPPLAELHGGVAELRGVREHLVAHLGRADYSAAATAYTTLQEKLGGKAGPITDKLRKFLGTVLGNKKFAPEQVAAAYAELVGELRRIASLGPLLATVRDSAKSLADSSAPRLAQRIQSVAVLANGEDSAFPALWREAWRWARVRSHLEAIEARAELVEISQRRSHLEVGLGKLYRDLVAKAAWLSTKKRASPKILAALAGYATAITRIGQGTGPNAVRYRRDAREAMNDAASAVPCWIMSHYKVSESIPAEFGAFDLVIVDEASQSDLWALPAIVRGAKILVVGDNKQVSPSAGFIDSKRIDELKNRFLLEQPFGMEMTPEKSLYDLAARVFSAEQVMLREHFRCVPTIIAYSNHNFYSNAISPLRVPKASERIDPPLVDVYVPDGRREGRDINKEEAEFVASEIAAILANPDLKDRTLGVVSLLGMEQAKHIDSLVRKRCGAAELRHRKFDCGDAQTFQGSERDIMFLSMVVDRSNCHAVSGNMFEQRYNVAGSRARDRMYLVRSVESNELSDRDALRRGLLGHFSKPLVQTQDEAVDLAQKCESGFEREVFTALTNRGYRVIPQVKSSAFRIDMVVEGASDSRLAIECDGDEFHGPERWEADMSRQRVLERAGWVFWRVFASTWVMRKEEVFAELVSRLDSMGIEPLGALERVPTLVEKREWRHADAEDIAAEEARAALTRAMASAR